MRTAACICLSLILAACGGTPIKEHYYTLSATPGAPVAATSTVSIHVGPVTVPEAVDRLGMVMRTSPHQVEISDAHRWAEPLKSAIPRVLAEALMRELGTARVTASRLGAGPGADFRVAVEVQRFDSSLEQGALLDALWTVTPAKGAARQGRSTIAEPLAAREPAGLAAAHSRALERMAREIAAEIRKPQP